MNKDTEKLGLLQHRKGTNGGASYTAGNLENNHYEPTITGREQLTSTLRKGDENMTATGLLFRINHAFLEEQYDVESDVDMTLRSLSDKEKETFVERMLVSIRSTPLSIGKKLKVVRLLRANAKYIEKRKRNTYYRKQVGKQKDGLSDRLSALKPWEGPIKKISGYFGSNVASFFMFLRTLFCLNLVILVVQAGFVAVPQIIFEGWRQNITTDDMYGVLSESILFYGAYKPGTEGPYSRPLAYFLTWFGVNLFSFIFIISSMVMRYRHGKMSETPDEFQFGWKTLSTWDFSITDRDGIHDHSTALKTEIKEMVREAKSKPKLKLHERLLRYIGRLVATVIVLGLLGGSAYLIYIAQYNVIPDDYDADIRDFFTKYQLTAVVSGLKFIVPLFFIPLTRLESWHPRIESKFTLARTTVFYFASLVIFIISLYDKTDDCQKQRLNSTDTPMFLENCCWENEIGVAVFQVILLDLLICIVVGLMFHLARAALVKCGAISKKFGYPEFDVNGSVLDLVYGQGLIWLGLYFSPQLAIIGIVKLIIVFYFRYLIARVAMTPPKQLFRASSTGNFYMAILLLQLYICVFPIAYAVIELHPSIGCGPFINLFHPAEIVKETVGDLPNWLEDALNYIGTPAVMVPLVILLIMLVIYYKTRSSSYRKVIEKLTRELMFERTVEKRQIFATAKAASAASLSRASASKFSSQESLSSALPSKKSTPDDNDSRVDFTIEEDDEM